MACDIGIATTPISDGIDPESQPPFFGHGPDTADPPADGVPKVDDKQLMIKEDLVAGAGFEPAAFRL